jgi:hypothetical protein
VKNKKLWWIITVIAIIAFSMIACSGRNRSSTQPSGAASNPARNTNPNAETDFQVTLTADSAGVRITSYTGTRANVVIPATIQSLPVREIGDDAFLRSSITSLVIPEGVTSMGWRAVAGSRSLTSVTLPSTLTNIAIGAFADCTSLTTIDLPASLREIGSNAFENTGLTSFPNWPAGVTTISPHMFARTNLRGEVIIPEGVTYIQSMAFMGRNITRVTLPSTIRSIGMQAFSNCSSLTTVIIPESIQNINFSSGEFSGSSNIDLASQAALRRVGYRGSF